VALSARKGGGFETVALDIIEVIRMNDPRFGVEPKERSKKGRK